MGIVVSNGDAYVLKSGNEKFLLDSPKKAKNFKGKAVQTTGTLDKDKNLIHIENRSASPAGLVIGCVRCVSNFARRSRTSPFCLRIRWNSANRFSTEKFTLVELASRSGVFLTIFNGERGAPLGHGTCRARAMVSPS